MNAPDRALQIKGAIAAFFAFGTALFGWQGWLVIIWLICMVLDYISGSGAALQNGTWKSKIAREGLWHKAGTILAVLVSALCDIALYVMLPMMNIEFIDKGYICAVVVVWYIFTELGSILENVSKLGASVPAFLINIIEKAKKQTEEEGEVISGNSESKKE